MIEESNKDGEKFKEILEIMKFEYQIERNKKDSL